MDVAVVGAGVMGSATAHHLARSGRRVVLFEQFTPRHKRGSSHGSSRIFRLSYRESRYVEMAMAAQRLWRDLERDSGRPLLHVTGGLDLGEGIEDNLHALSECGAEGEMLSGHEASARFPQVKIPSDVPVLWQPDSGIVMAADAIDAFQEGFVAEGGELRTEARVTGIDPNGESVSVECNGQRLTVGSCVVTAGGWVRSLVEPLGISAPVRPTRETVAYFDLQAAPPTVVEWGDPSIYALPASGEGLKVGEHIAGPETDPDEEGRVNDESVERLITWVGDRFPGAAPEPHRTETCIYTNTEDEDFILERHDRVVIGSPCSGHGFKFAPLIGRMLAELAEETL